MLKRRNFLGAWHAKQYDGRPRKNPLFAHRDMLPRTKIIIALSGVVVIFVACLWLVFASPWLNITSVRIEGLTTVTPARVEQMILEQRSYRRWFIFSQQNIFAFDEEKMRDRLNTDFTFESLAVSVDGKTVHVVATEKIVEIALKSGQKTFFLGLDGTIVREATAEEAKSIDVRLGTTTLNEGEVLPVLQPTMPIIVDQSASEHPVFSTERIETMLKLNERLREYHIEPRLFQFTTLDAPWTRIETAQSYAILLDLEQDFSPQMRSLLAVLEQKANPEDPYEYIDVRFGDHVYIK